MASMRRRTKHQTRPRPAAPSFFTIVHLLRTHASRKYHGCLQYSGVGRARSRSHTRRNTSSVGDREYNHLVNGEPSTANSPTMLVLALVGSAALVTNSAPQPPGAAVAQRTDLAELYRAQTAQNEACRVQAEATQGRLSRLGAMRDSLWPLPPRLKAHDIPVITLNRTLTAEALHNLLAHECCAVHVRGFVELETCEQIADRLHGCGDAFTNWNIHQAQQSTQFSATEVDKIGVTSGEALDSLEAFRGYLDPSSPMALDELLPAELNPFTALRAALDEAHSQGCRRSSLGGWPLPAGTFRRMYTSKGLIHADTATLLSRESGEFSANLYICSPPGQGALSVYPVQQYAVEPGGLGDPLTSPPMLADLQSLAKQQAAGFDKAAQATLRAALPLERRMAVRDGDLVLINTGRFHRVEPYSERAVRLSGQCWLSFQRGKALRMWV